MSTIGNSAFQWCSSLTSINITDNVESVGDYAFSNCKSLASVTFGNSILTIGTGAFDRCSSLLSIALPEKLTSIGNVAFRYCTSLTFVSIPQSVKKIGSGAFSECNSLSDVYCAAENIPNTTSNAFDSTPVKTATLHVPNRSIHLYKESIPWSKFGNFAGLYGSTYSLSYIIDDGTEYKSYNVWEDEKITPEDEPAKEGYTFSGWSEIPEWMPAHDVTVAGAFNINLYKLTYMVDGEEYKSYEVEYGATITPEAAPTKEGYTFSGWSEIPQTMPAKDVTITGTFTQKPLPECAPPVIDVIGGKLKLSCETEAVTFNTNVTYNSSSKNLEGDEEIVLSGDIICHISVFASKEGYQNSDTVTKDVKLRVGAAGDANADGEVDIADAVHIVNFIVGKIDQLAPQKDMDQTDPE